MELSHYQEQSKTTAIYPNQGTNIVYPAFGLMSEAGEIADIVKRVVRDKGGVMDADDKQKLRKEIGDVLWYLAQIATEIGASLDDAAKANLEKLAARKGAGSLVDHERNKD